MKKGLIVVGLFLSAASSHVYSMENKSNNGVDGVDGVAKAGAQFVSAVIGGEKAPLKTTLFSAIATRTNAESAVLGGCGVRLMRNDNTPSQVAGFALISAGIAHYTGYLVPGVKHLMGLLKK